MAEDWSGEKPFRGDHRTQKINKKVRRIKKWTSKLPEKKKGNTSFSTRWDKRTENKAALRRRSEKKD